MRASSIREAGGIAMPQAPKAPKAVRWLAGIVLSVVSLATWSQSGPDARIHGFADVNTFGEGTYTIPLELPNGANGLNPSLSLVYSHRARGGLFGVGWSLAGLPRIERCIHTVAQDSAAREVKLDAEDRFCLEGNKLRRLGSGSYWATNAQYRTEFDTYTRFTAYSATSPSSSWFRAETKEGLIYEYGHTADSRRLAPGTSTPYAWLVNRIIDRSGNYIDFEYALAGSLLTEEARPLAIRYAGNNVTGRAPSYTMSFDYGGQANGPARWIAGGQLTFSYRVLGIALRTGSQIVTQYQFGYESSPTTGHSRLTSIQRSGAGATMLLYQEGTQGWGSASSGATNVATPAYSFNIDLNDDGLEDLVFTTHATSGSGYWAYRLANSFSATRYSDAVITATGNHYYDRAIVGDVESDGDADIFVPCQSNYARMCVMASNRTTGLGTLRETDLLGPGWLADVDGDGQDDWVTADNQYIYVRLRTGYAVPATWAATVQYAALSSANVMFTGDAFGPYGNWSRSGVRKTDFNGDGRDDLLLSAVSGSAGTAVWVVFLSDRTSAGQAFYREFGTIPASPQGTPPVLLDLDSDGKSDLLYVTDTSGNTVTRFGTTTGLGAAQPGPSLAGVDLNSLRVVDWDGDGRRDLLARSSGGTWYVYPSNGRYFGGPAATSLPGSAEAATVRISNAGGNGLADVGYAVGTTWYTHLHAGVLPDLLKTVTDGFGNSIQFAYSTLVHSPGYMKYSDPEEYSNYPNNLRLSDWMSVVTSLIESNGVGTPRNRSFKYVGGRDDPFGRGFQGFEKRTTNLSPGDAAAYDQVITEEFSNTFPTAGMPIDRVARLAYPTDGLSGLWGAHYSYASITEGAAGQRHTFTYPATVVMSESASVVPWSITRTTTMTASSYGTPTSVRTQIRGSGGLYPNAVLTEEMSNADWLNDTASWCVGRPGHTTVTRSHTIMPGGDPIARATTRTWDGNCRLETQTLAPGTSQALATSLAYDSHGNISSFTESGLNAEQVPESRQTILEWDPSGSHGPPGQFLTKLTNPLSHVTQFRWHPGLGLLTQHIDPNGLSTTWAYDSLGRRTGQTRPDGTRTEWTYLPCDSDCTGIAHAVFKVRTRELDTTGSVVLAEGLRLFDGLERERRRSRRMLGGGFANVLTEYNRRGLVARVSAPYWTGASPYWTVYSHDAGYRLSQIQRPISDSNSSSQSTTITYDGLTQTVVDAEGKSSTLIRSASGQVVRSRNHLLQIVDYTYNPFGELTETTDPAGNRISIAYEPQRGFKTSTSDPDMGTWQYAHSAFGELRWQQDARGQETRFLYDRLSRPRLREEIDATTRWSWDSPAANGGFGRLRYVAITSGAGDGATDMYEYDGLGRVQKSSTVTASDGQFHFLHEYDAATGLLQTLTYPESVGTRFKVQYEYANGQLQRVRDFNSPGTVFWEATATNARGQVIDHQYGNGLHINRTFDQVTGLLARIDSGFPGGAADQQLQYTWDKAGNLRGREDLNQGTLREDFYYDDVHRLDRVQRNGVTTLDVSYDVLGNVTSKTGVGAYAYTGAQAGCTYHGHAQPHAVRNAAATVYCYDANGNMTSRGGQPITWYSYNLPKRIEHTGGNFAEFSYGPTRQRYKQVHTASAGSTTAVRTTLYAGGLFERAVFMPSAGTTATYFRHYIEANGERIASHARVQVSTGSTTHYTAYQTFDHLGSTEGLHRVIEPAGLPSGLARYSNDAFGQRRDRDWEGPPSSGDMSSMWVYFSNRGFTGHEHLDNVGGLIHMNGRIYDPNLGRFISADPLVQDPFNAQSLNRYSYVFNNPLSYTDPTGYDPTGCAFWCASAIATVANWAGSLLGDDDPPPPPPWDYTPATPDAAPPSASQSAADGTVGGERRPTISEALEHTTQRIAEREALLEMGDGTTPYVPTYTVWDGAAELVDLVSTASGLGGIVTKQIIKRASKNLIGKAARIRNAGTHPAARNQRTIAVGEDAEGNLYAGSSNGFDRGQRTAAEALNIKCVGCKAGAHAEENLMREVPGLRRVGTSARLPCGPSEHNCRGQLLERGIEIQNEALP